jgi:anti-anti-sigma regulatory factor
MGRCSALRSVAEGAPMKSTTGTILPFPSASNAGQRKLLKDLRNSLCSSEAPVIVDLSGRRSLNHADIEVLLDCLAQAAGRDNTVILVAGSQIMRVLLEVTRISSLVLVFDSIEEALDNAQMPEQYRVEDIGAAQSQQLWSA